jgi:predicted phage-related endonuclease
MEIEKGVVVFDDDIAQWLKQYKDALTKVKEWQEVADIARSHLETALGDSEIALYQGKEVVRWSTVESRRFDVKRAREILPPQVIETLEVVNHSRRFSLVNDDPSR